MIVNNIMQKFSLFMLAIYLGLTLVGSALAVLPDEVLKDPVLEGRARIISQDLRCLVCQNQSIDDSNAPLAKDLRLIVRERLTTGDSDAQVFEYVVSRYGNYVLLKPPFQTDTYILWMAPFLLMLMALAVAFNYLRKRPALDEENPEDVKED
jgi:cytochrome c-type biogenesis protein CcmH